MQGTHLRHHRCLVTRTISTSLSKKAGAEGVLRLSGRARKWLQLPRPPAPLRSGASAHPMLDTQVGARLCLRCGVPGRTAHTHTHHTTPPPASRAGCLPPQNTLQPQQERPAMPTAQEGVCVGAVAQGGASGHRSSAQGCLRLGGTCSSGCCGRREPGTPSRRALLIIAFSVCCITNLQDTSFEISLTDLEMYFLKRAEGLLFLPMVYAEPSCPPCGSRGGGIPSMSPM